MATGDWSHQLKSANLGIRAVRAGRHAVNPQRGFAFRGQGRGRRRGTPIAQQSYVVRVMEGPLVAAMQSGLEPREISCISLLL